MTNLYMNFTGPLQPDSQQSVLHQSDLRCSDPIQSEADHGNLQHSDQKNSESLQTTLLDPELHQWEHDDSRAHENEQTPDKITQGVLSRTLGAMREAASIAGLLRLGGAALMVGSLSVYLLQGVDSASDLQRYLLLLAQTLLLTCAGFGVGYLLKEPRGARVFFSLGLISIPANFAVLGAMVYSIVPMDTLLDQYPAYASWHSGSIRELAIALSAGLAVLVPMSVFCFAVMARQSKWWLSAFYLAACATLLIPVRDSVAITTISTVSALVLFSILYRKKSGQNAISTREEKFAKALLFLPTAIMLVRSASLYGGDVYLALAMFTALYVTLRHFVVQRSGVKAINIVVESITAVSGIALATVFTVAVLENLNYFRIVPTALVLFQLVLLALNIELVRHVKSTNMQTLIHTLWAALSLSLVAIFTGFEYDVNGLWTGLAAGTVLIIAGGVVRQRIAVVCGALCLVLVLLSHGDALLSIMRGTGWLGMAIAGSLTIIAGSVLERFWPLIRMQLGGSPRITIEAKV